MIIFQEIPAETVLQRHVLGDTDKAQPWITQGYPVLRVPAPEEPPRGRDRHPADHWPIEHPARITETYPGLGVGFFHVFHRHAADPIREHMVARTRHRMGQALESQLGKAGQELVLVLAAEQAEDPVSDHVRTFPRGDHKLQTEEILVMQFGQRGDGGGFLRLDHGCFSLRASLWRGATRTTHHRAGLTPCPATRKRAAGGSS